MSISIYDKFESDLSIISKNGEDKDNPERPTEQERDKVLGEAMAIPLQAAEK